MTDERDAFRLPPDQFAALKEAMREGPVRAPSANQGDYTSGIDAATLRKTVTSMIDDELSRRRVLSDPEIRAIAKEVAQGLFRELVEPIQDNVRQHLTIKQIEEAVYGILTDIGMPAETREERKSTKETIEGMFRGHKRTGKMGASFLEELPKSLAQQLIGGGVIGAVIYAILKGGQH